MKKISVVMTTARQGGFDVLYHSLKQQTMALEDFELIIVDELYDKRRFYTKEFESTQHRALPAIHYNNGAAFNQALRAARGELICFTIDFLWMPPTYLQDHWDFYQNNAGWSMTGYVDRYSFPPLGTMKNDLWEYHCAFEKVFDFEFAEKWFSENRPVYRERKGGAGIIHPDGKIEMPGHLIYLIPDSIPLAVLKELNGLDEAYDGGYGSNDIDVGVRANLLGWHFGLNPTCIVQKLGTPELSAQIPGVSKPKVRTPEENYQLFLKRMEMIKEGKEQIAVPNGRGAWR